VRRRLDSIRRIGDDEGMVKKDERAHVPAVDAAARERLTRALDREGVVAAMLIGSQARGTPGPLSDVDIAYWHEAALVPDERWKLASTLLGAAIDALGHEQIDLVPLNGAPPLIQHRAIRDAVRLVERDRDERVRLETQAMIQYLDTEPLRVALRAGLKKRIKEDRFGRR
jgi:predicted nucleotidyltransferase